MMYTDNTPNSKQKFSNIESRPNKVAKGFTKNAERMKRQGRKHITDNTLLRLTVRGTTDELAGCNFLFKKTMKEHPIDKGYFKEVFILTDAGKRKLKIKKSCTY